LTPSADQPGRWFADGDHTPAQGTKKLRADTMTAIASPAIGYNLEAAKQSLDFSSRPLAPRPASTSQKHQIPTMITFVPEG